MVNPSNTDFRILDEAEGRDLRSVLTSESIRKFEARLGEYRPRGPVG